MSSERGGGHTRSLTEAGDSPPSAFGRSRPPALIAELTSAVRAYQRANDDLDQAAYEALGINRNDGKCLDVLDEREPMTAGALAEELGLTTGAITTLVDRLEKAGYVTRTRDTADRRRVRLELTPLARRRIRELYGPMAEHGLSYLAPLSDDDLRVITEFLREGTKLHLEGAARIRGEA